MSRHTLQVFKGSSEGEIIQSETQRVLGNDEVLVRITHAGLCGTDLHFKNEGIVLGHEGVGVVQEVGPAVASFKLGDRAGWGFLHESCLQCNVCLTGNEIFCEERKTYWENNRNQGGFGSHAIWTAAFLFHIPEAIPSAHAAPLMCAGATVFNAMEMHGLRPTERVGILGIGGLGHLAIQFAAKMGCQVVVFSGTPGKEAEAKALGATEFHVTLGVDALKNVKAVDHLYEPTSVMPEWEVSDLLYFQRMYLTGLLGGLDRFTPVLAARATIYPMTLALDNFPIPYFPALMKGLRIQFTICSSHALHVKMHHFVAQHRVEPIVQEFPLTVEGIKEAMKKLDSGEVRYRAVLVANPKALV